MTQQYLQYPAPVSRVVAEIPAEDGSGVWQVTAYETLDEYTARVGDTLGRFAAAVQDVRRGGRADRLGPAQRRARDSQAGFAADGVLASVLTFDVGDDVAGPITSTGLFTNSSDKSTFPPSAVYVLRTDSPIYAGSNGTRILKFAFADDGTTSLEAAGNVDGRVLNQFSLDEYEGLLRIVTTETTYDYLRRHATDREPFVRARASGHGAPRGRRAGESRADGGSEVGAFRRRPGVRGDVPRGRSAVRHRLERTRPLRGSPARSRSRASRTTCIRSGKTTCSALVAMPTRSRASWAPPKSRCSMSAISNIRSWSTA